MQSLETQTGKKLVWIGHGYFAAQLAALGWQIKYMPYMPQKVYTWSDIVQATGNGIYAKGR